MSIHIKTGDAWHTCASVHVNVSGTWHTCKQVYVNVSGTWKPCILVSGSKTVDGPVTYNKTVTLSNVKNGTTVNISGTAKSNFNSWAIVYTATGATPSEIKSKTVPSDGSSVNFSYNFTATSTTVKITKGVPNNTNLVITNCKIKYTQEYYP